MGPNYHRPPDAGSTEPTRPKARGVSLRPRTSIPKGAWWEVYNDAELNGYEQQLLAANQSLPAAKDRLEQARSLARVASAGYFPDHERRSQCFANAVFGKSPGSRDHRPCRSRRTPSKFRSCLSYEPDLFGKVRRTLEASNAIAAIDSG